MNSSTSSHSRYERLPRVSIVLFLLTAFCLLLSLLFRLSPAFSDFFNQSISQPLRWLLAFMTSWLPFSLAEGLLLFSPVLLGLLVFYAVRYHTGSWRAVGVYLAKLVSVACLFFILFAFVFSAGYHGATLDSPKKLDLARQDVSVDDLYQTAEHLIEQVNREAANVVYEYKGFSVMPYTREEMNRKLMTAYDKFCEDYDFLGHFNSRVKPVLLSIPMSYTHITGVYSYFTGEANLNVNFPDYTLAFTAAHELAHQRGIARENEANFIAYLVCIGSDDAYLRYSGYLNMYEYVSSALYRADSSRYYEVNTLLKQAVRYEQIAYSAFFDQYRDSVAGNVSDTVNDTYLKLQGTEGTRSYGLVVDLAVAYDKKISSQP